MNTNKNIQVILDDLYKIDPSLKKMERDLIKIIFSLISLKPKAKMDEAFKAELREKILAKIESLQAKKEEKFSFTNIFSSRVPAYSLITSLVLVLIVGGFYFSQNLPKGTVDFGGTFKITSLKNNAFGTLNESGTTFSIPESTQGIGAFESSTLAAPVADAELARVTNSKLIGAGGGGMIMPAPDWVNYTYSYAGDDIDFDQDTVLVLRRTKGGSTAKSLANLVKGIYFDLINLSSFPSSEIEGLTMSQNKQYGYSVYLSFTEGIVSVFKNWRMWPNPWAECSARTPGKACAGPEPLNKSDVPSDATLIEIANDFVKKHSIDMSAYGKPVINSDWQVFIQQILSEERSIPEEVQIVYPLKLDGKTAYEVSGNVMGINVSIDIRNKKVAGIYNLTTQEHEGSNYTAASLEKILKTAENGGINNYYYKAPDQKTVELELDTPSLGYLKHYRHNPTGYSEELLVPALIFPVKDAPEDQSFRLRRNVVVPLADEMLQNNDNNVYPMPLLEVAEKPEITE